MTFQESHPIYVCVGYTWKTSQSHLLSIKGRQNPNLKEVVKKEIIKLLDAGIIYPISDSNWVSPVHVVPKKGGVTVVKNDKNELIPMRTVTGHMICIDYRKLNAATRKRLFPSILHRSDVRNACTPQVLLFSRWVFRIFPDSYPSGRPRKDHIHLSIWYFRMPQDALWAL